MQESTGGDTKDAASKDSMKQSSADGKSGEMKQSPDPQMKAVLTQLAKLNGKPIETLDADEARKQPTMTKAVLATLKQEGKSVKPLEVGDTDDKKIDDANGKIPVRIYTPKGDGPFPVVVYYHGGGFVIATIDTYDASARAICSGANAIVVSVEYRKAPENRYPAAVDDAFAAYTWVRANAAGFKGDPNRVAVAGESAGGNLATVTCMKAKEAGTPLPVFQLLVYPVTNNDMSTPSYVTYAHAKPLNKDAMSWFFKQYLRDMTSANDPHVSPMKATDLSYMPPAMIITAELDPLHSDGELYAQKLKAAGVNVEYKHYNGVTHEFFGAGAALDTAKQAEMDANAALRSAFAK